MPEGPIFGNLHSLPMYDNLGRTRPFGPGEYLQIGEDDMWANEMTDSVEDNGQFKVIPTLWLINGVPHKLSTDQAWALAQRSGLNWPTFASQKEADSFTEARENKWQTTPMGRTDMQPPLWSRRWPPVRR